MEFYHDHAIPDDLTWETDTLMMVSTFFGYLGYEIIEGVEYRSDWEFDPNCTQLPIGEQFYIPVKVEVLNETKLGWIKFEIVNFAQIHIIQSAIQE